MVADRLPRPSAESAWDSSVVLGLSCAWACVSIYITDFDSVFTSGSGSLGGSIGGVFLTFITGLSPVMFTRL